MACNCVDEIDVLLGRKARASVVENGNRPSHAVWSRIDIMFVTTKAYMV
jgi:hypothetical protein